MRLRVWVLVGAAALRLVAGPATVACMSCCPTTAGGETTLSSVGCCDEGCGDKIVRAETRPCLASVQRTAALWAYGTLPTANVELVQVFVPGVFLSPGDPTGSPPTGLISPLRL